MPWTHRGPNSKAGFTLIEIVVVLVVIAVLASIAIPNYRAVQTKAEAARISTQLHYLEDAIIQAIIEGAVASDFVGINAGSVEQSVLGDFLTMANLSDVPEGMSFQLTAGPKRYTNGYYVSIGIISDASHQAILDELHAMFPRTSSEGASYLWVDVDSDYLAVAEN